MFTDFKLVTAYMAKTQVFLNRQEMIAKFYIFFYNIFSLFEQLVQFLKDNLIKISDTFCENIITAMSNLVNANWNVGFDYVISLF